MMWVLSLGGSIVAPKGGDDLVDVAFISEFYTRITKRIAMNDRFIIIVGGGSPARVYQNAYKRLQAELDEQGGARDEVAEGVEHAGRTSSNDALDRIGIAATHLNAALIREVFAEHAERLVVRNPEAENLVFNKSVLIGAGWKPGFSTDLDAVVLARRFGAQTIVNISNIAQIYTADPKHEPSAEPLESIRWDAMIAMVGERWKPGMNVPFDPVACVQARAAGLQVVSVGPTLANLAAVFEGKDYVGTRIW